MNTFRTIVLASALVAISAGSASAQFSEPAAFQAAHPDRDVLNGGALTPEGRAHLGMSTAAPLDANASTAPMPVSPRSHRRHRR